MTEEEAESIADRIAAGHAYDKHVINAYDKHVIMRREFPELSTREQFASAIREVLLRPSANRTLSRNREAFWSDSRSMIVLVDHERNEHGTAFRPISGRKYFEDGL